MCVHPLACSSLSLSTHTGTPQRWKGKGSGSQPARASTCWLLAGGIPRAYLAWSLHTVWRRDCASRIECQPSCNDRLQKTKKQSFRLPLDSANTPIIMFAAGTGLAPFRGFIEQRAIQPAANPATKLAPAYLFPGCRSSTCDRLYASQMDEWQAAGAVQIFYTFSQEPDQSDGCKYVAERMMKESGLIAEAWMKGARSYTCGNRAFAVGVGKAAEEAVKAKDLEALKSLREQAQGRDATEVERLIKTLEGKK